MAEVIGEKLVLNGYVYVWSKEHKSRTYWECRRLRLKECRARVITSSPHPASPITVFKELDLISHAEYHPPNQEECEAERLTISIKRKAKNHPEQPPAQLLRTELAGTSSGVLSQLPERENLKKLVRRQHRINLPPNPKSMDDLGDLPDRYRQTLAEENFLIHNSRGQEEGRVLVFATRRNLELLGRSPYWFLDGTFKVCPSIFTQVFTVLWIVRRRTLENNDVVPLVYALLTSEEKVQYSTVLRAIQSAAADLRIENIQPQKIMCDFELAILNACADVFPDASVSCCLFHLGQSVYRKIQAEGLQQNYNDPDDRHVKEQAHMILALAYVPPSEVTRTFNILKNNICENLLPVMGYFRETYVIGRPGRGRRRPVEPRYHPDLWNHYEAALNSSHQTNNISEGWHNRIRLVVGKHHPDLYSALSEFQKEQADSEIVAAELSLARKVKAAPKRKWIKHQRRIRSIVYYFEYKNDNQDLEFLKAIGHNINL